ncbi:hypothetical protein [Mesorhizobium sp. M0909]|uniref:hypothetical protein n=1 Tax=Mesorhizobium sp. M0909 TaxID=2957024 RepID=UPI00333D40A1
MDRTGRDIAAYSVAMSLMLFASVAVAAGKFTNTGTPIPLEKLIGKNEWLKKHAKDERQFTYTISVDCGDYTTKRIYILRGDQGNYIEDFCGSIFNGALTYVSSDPVVVQGVTINGLRYNSTDEAGEWKYFFGSDDLGGGQYFLTFDGAHYVPGEDPGFGGGEVAERTQP